MSQRFRIHCEMSRLILAKHGALLGGSVDKSQLQVRLWWSSSYTGATDATQGSPTFHPLQCVRRAIRFNVRCSHAIVCDIRCFVPFIVYQVSLIYHLCHLHSR